jgi:SWI/SNF-related matrix-associated actin-dependent regulator 1 of chromatin subfamily A
VKAVKATSIERWGKNQYQAFENLRAAQIEIISTLPGLRYSNGVLTGGPDAISAAIKRLKLKPSLIVKPIESTVDDKIKEQYSLRPFQQVGVGTMASRLTTYGGGILADDMGLGKTRQAIVVTTLLGCKGNLVACPASVRDQWCREIHKIIPNGKVVSLGPVTNKRTQKAWDDAEDADWVVVSYALLDKAITHGFAHRYPAALILDEFHLLKGRKTERSKLVDNAGQTAGYRIGLTGSPIWDRPRDLFKQLDILVPGKFGRSGFDFDVAYCGGKQGEYGFDNKGSSNEEELSERLKFYMLRREKREVAKDLPRFTRTFLWVDGTDKARGEMNKSMVSPSPDGMYRALRATLEDKIPYAVEQALSARKFVVFTWEKAHAKKIAEAIVRSGVQCGLITGDYSVKERDQAIADARTSGHGIVATIDAAGVGVDGLQHVASTLIFHAIDWVPQKLMQAEARLDRIGQTEPVQAIYIGMRDSMDEVVCHTVVKKLDMQHAVLGGDRGPRDAIDSELMAGTRKQDKEVLSSIYDQFQAHGADDMEWDDGE